MKITRIAKAKGYRIFRDFSWSTNDLSDFARYNIIYGWNGAGKTSLSNIFRHIQLKAPLSDGEVDIVVDKTRVSSSAFAVSALPDVRTFNRDTVNRNIFESTSQQFPPVFYLGEDSVEKQKKIETLKHELSESTDLESRAQRLLSERNSALESFSAEEAKGIKNLLTVAGGGPYNNYNAANFKVEIQSLAGKSPLPPPLEEKERQRLLATKESKVMGTLDEPTIAFPDFSDLFARTQTILNRSIVSSVIGSVAENPKVAAWVQTGLTLHRDECRQNDCHFCGQPLPSQRIQQLEAHFNDEFERFQSEIDLLIDEVKKAQGFSDTLRAPPKEALYTNLRPEYEKALTSLKLQAVNVRRSLEPLVHALQAKRNDPFKTFLLHQFFTQPGKENPSGLETFFQIVIAGTAALSQVVGKSAYEQMRSIIGQHNGLTNRFDTEIKRVRWTLAQQELLRALSEWQKKTKEIDEAREKLENAQRIGSRLKKEIAGLEVLALQHRRPAEELNHEIAAYLGRDELKFEVEKSGYRITRGNQPATHLSEGERTAIAFLYFLKSLQSTDFDLESGVVVIDDPVSSLDANSLFSAFGFMKQRTSKAGQLFVLTHNFAFFRQVRNWFYSLPGQRKTDPSKQPARFYMLSPQFTNGIRTASIAPLDPFLHQYESEYHYLFKRVNEEANKAVASGLESYYAIPNLARRLLESFLAFRVPNVAGELYQKLEAIEFDTVKKTRVLRFLHTYSHLDQVSEPEHDISLLSETPAVLKDLLELIEFNDAGHYKSMMGLIAPEHEVG